MGQKMPHSPGKRSHATAQTMVMPTLVLPTSGPIPGHYMFTEFDQFSGFNAYPRQKPQTTSLIPKHYGTNEVTSNQHNEPTKKRRLTMNQTKSLEGSFAIDSKLVPERKNKLAVELGLQPRQVAIWYQNRRARTKTKHLEEKYDALHEQYQGVLEKNKKLEAEIIKLKRQLGSQEKLTLGGPKDVKPAMEKWQEASMSTNVKEKERDVAPLTVDQKTERTKTHVQIDAANMKQQTLAITEDNSNNACATVPAHSALVHNANSPASQGTSYLQENNVMLKHEAFGTTQGMVSYHGAQKGAQHERDCQVSNSTLCSLYNHHHNHQQQQYQLFQQLQHQYNLSCFGQLVGDIRQAEHEENVGLVPTATPHPLHIEDNFFGDYRFKLEDETASVYFGLATEA